MEVVFSKEALKDLEHWKSVGDLNVKTKIMNLLKAIQLHPFTGIGKPESLKHDLAGLWSRRITREHRLVYRVAEGKIFVYSLRGHYE